MTNRWAILALLFAARTVMGVQFQAVGSLGPGLTQVYSVGLAEIGFAIGLYLLPGVVIALPGSAIGARFGERQVVAASLVLMAIGGALMAVTTEWSLFLTGQLIAGVGGIMLNMLMTKMVADWFAGREISTAMGIFINSWPLGIALSLVVLPPVFQAFGLAVVFLGIAILSAIFAILVLVLYRAPEQQSAVPRKRRLDRRETLAALLSGLVWGFVNGGFAVIFGFGPALLVEAGFELDEAVRRTSLVLWTTAVVTPFGGWLADHIERRDQLIALGLVALAALTPMAAVLPGNPLIFIGLGLCVGAVAGAIMSLPAIALPPEARAIGVGLFFSFTMRLVSAVRYLLEPCQTHLGLPLRRFILVERSIWPL
ncbi:MAG: MFS transporter [Boseongicola sp.]